MQRAVLVMRLGVLFVHFAGQRETAVRLAVVAFGEHVLLAFLLLVLAPGLDGDGDAGAIHSDVDVFLAHARSLDRDHVGLVVFGDVHAQIRCQFSLVLSGAHAEATEHVIEVAVQVHPRQRTQRVPE